MRYAETVELVRQSIALGTYPARFSRLINAIINLETCAVNCSGERGVGFER